MLEMVLMQMRTMEGLSLDDFRDRTGADPAELFAAPLAGLLSHSLVSASATRIALTRTGQLLANYVIRELAASCDVPLTVTT
jgi:coproporphyrinogen III oxidase-like Fe-S oxidoreductase